MYVSIRDDTLQAGGWGSLREGLRALEIGAVELNFDRADAVISLEDFGERIALDNEQVFAEYRQALTLAGIRVPALLLANDFNRGDREAEVAWVVRAAKAAKQLEANAVRIDAIMTGQAELPLDQRVGIFAEAMRKVLQETEATDTHFGVENHGLQGNDPSFLQALFDAVGSDRLGVTLDTGNFYWSGKPLDALYPLFVRLAPRIKHTHVKNINYPPAVRHTQRELGWEYGQYVSPIPEGDINLSKLVSILKSAGYTGDLCIEDESLGKFTEEERREVLKRDVEYVKGLI